MDFKPLVNKYPRNTEMQWTAIRAAVEPKPLDRRV